MEGAYIVTITVGRGCLRKQKCYNSSGEWNEVIYQGQSFCGYEKTDPCGWVGRADILPPFAKISLDAVDLVS